MNYIDVIPQALTVFAQGMDMNRNVRVIGTAYPSHTMCCRFILDVSDIYDGPPCQWTCEINMDKGVTSITFKPCGL